MSREDAAYGTWLLSQHMPFYDLYRRYDRGDHPWLFASDKMRDLFETLMRRYRLNVCRPVVRGVSRRINVDGWDGDEAAQDWWETEGQRLQNRHTKETVRQGDGYLLVWPQTTMAGPLRTHRLRADEAIVVYSEEDPDRPQFAVKLWVLTPGGRRPDNQGRQILRANVYYPDHAERWQMDAPSVDGRAIDLTRISESSFMEMDDDVGAEVAYTGTLQAAGRDGLLPVQHFPAQPDATPYGTSILADVVPVQDEINHTARIMLAAEEAYGLPLRVFTAFVNESETHTVEVDGEEVKVTSDGLPDYHPLKDWFLTLPGENSKAIQLPEADLEQLLEVRRAQIQNATLTSGVPLGLLAEDSGSVPSGVALRVVESPLTDLAVDLQQDFTQPWRNVARLYGWDASPSWSSPVTMDDTEKHALALQKIEVGVPPRKAVEDAGIMTADEFDKAVDEARDMDTSVGEMLLRAEREGRDPADLLR